MRTETQKHLDLLSEAHGHATDYRLHKILAVSKTAVSNWRAGKGGFADSTAIRVAELLQIDAAELLAKLAAERAKTDGEKKLWLNAARRLQRTAAAFTIAVIAAAAAHTNSANASTHPSAGPAHLATRYIMTNVRRETRGAAPLAAVTIDRQLFADTSSRMRMRRMGSTK